MKVSIFVFSIIIALSSLFLTGCKSSNAIVTSSAGTIGPSLKNPLTKNQNFLVISALRDIKISVISENIFDYKEFNSAIIPNLSLNDKLTLSMASTLKQMNYKNIQTKTLNRLNVLNTTDIHSLSSQLSGSSTNGIAHIPPKGVLTPAAKAFLANQVKNTSIDTIILLTQSGNQALEYDIKCELSKNNTYRQASLDTHLYLYKLYVIDAHSLQILTWITGSPSGKLADTRLCKSKDQLNLADSQYLNSILARGLQRSVSKDLSKALGRRSLD